MKKAIALLTLALATGFASAAQTANNVDARCNQLSSDISTRSALFLKVSGAAPASTEGAASTQSVALQRAHDKEIVLHDIAGEIWSLRTRMAYLDCVQAKTFAY